MLLDRIYRRSEAGAQAFAAGRKPCPPEYQRILGLIQEETHSDVVRGCLRQFSDALLADWLAEMEELGLLCSQPADSTLDLDFTSLFNAAPAAPPRLGAEDARRIDKLARTATEALGDKGAFLSPDRLRNREPLGKTPGEISVLVVEDDPDQAALAELRVSMAGYRVRLTANRAEMLQALKDGPPPDLVLLDIRLPDGDGFEILAQLRRHPKLALLPVVMLTAVTGKDNVRRGLRLGADG